MSSPATNVLQIGTVVDTKAQQQLDELTARFTTQIKTMQAQIDSLNAKIASFGTVTKEAARTSNSEITEASHGLMAFSNIMGISMPRAAARFLASISVIGTVMAAAFPVLIITEFAKKIAEASDKAGFHQQKLDKMSESAIESTTQISKLGDSFYQTTLRIDDQIRALEHKPQKNAVALALDEARQKADDLTISINNAISKQVELFAMQGPSMMDKAERALASFSSGGAIGGSQLSTLNNDLMKGVIEAQNKLIEIRNKLTLDQSPAGDHSAIEQDKKDYKSALDAYIDMLNGKQAALTKYINDNSNFEFRSIGNFATGDTTTAIYDPNTDPDVKALKNKLNILRSTASEGQLAMQQAAKAGKGGVGAASMDQIVKNIDQQVSDYNNLNSIKQKTVELDAQINEEQVKRAFYERGLTPTPEEEASMEKTKENTIYNSKREGLEHQLELYSKYPNLFKNKIDELNAQIEENEKEHQANLAKIDADAAQRQANIQLTRKQDELNDSMRAMQEENTKEQANDILRVKQIEQDSQRGLETRKDERKQLLDIYNQEFNDIKARIHAQLQLQEQFRQTLLAMGKDENDPAYRKSLQDTIHLQQQLDQATEKYSSNLADVRNQTQKTTFISQEFIKKLQTSTKQMWEDFKSSWQQALGEFNAGFVNSVNTWIETGKGFGQAMEQTFAKMAEGFIDQLIQMGLQWVETHLLMLIFSKTTQAATAAATITSDAAVAAAGAYAATTPIPIVGPVLAPGAAAIAFADVMAFNAAAGFAEGGLVPATGLALIHKGERILPASMSGKGDFGMGPQFSLQSTNIISGIDGPSIKKMLDVHGDIIGEHTYQYVKTKLIRSGVLKGRRLM